MYYLKHELEWFIRYKTRGDSRVFYIWLSTDCECFKWLKPWVSNGLSVSNGEVVLKINVVLAEKIKAKVYVN
jgi:hypothetical protein